MKEKKVMGLKKEEFKRLTGVKKTTFKEMLKEVKKEVRKKRKKGGKKREVSIEKMVLMTLEYWREYRTYFHISKSYGISESWCYKIIKEVEEALIRSGKFRLPGKKELLKEGIKYTIVDVAEIGIERPKKNRGNIIQGKRKSIQ